jgi:hypothetical protein
VYDLDGAGKSQGFGYASKNYVDANGTILDGPEFLTVFAGATTAATVWTASWRARLISTGAPQRGNVSRVLCAHNTGTLGLPRRQTHPTLVL